jgi:hypothetical protein
MKMKEGGGTKKRRESSVRAGLCLLGMTDAEIDRAMREGPVRPERRRKRRDEDIDR